MKRFYLVTVALVLCLLGAITANAQDGVASGDLIYSIDYSTQDSYPFYRIDAPEGSSFDVIDGVLQIENTVEQGGAWSLQPIIADLMSLQEGNDYIVRLTYKSTVSASVNFNMGTWGSSMSKSDIQLEASDEFQTLEVMFAKSTVDATENNAHIIIQCGSYVGTLQISKVEVFEIVKQVTDDNPDNDNPVVLIPLSYFNSCAMNSVPEGFRLFADGMEERVAGGSYGSGSRFFNDFAAGGDFTGALYMRSNYLTYGFNDEEHKLTMEAGKTYTLTFNAARWKSSGEFLKVLILDAAGNEMLSQTVTCNPDVNGAKTAVKGSSAYSIDFTPEAAGDYELRFVVANNADGEDAGDTWHELLLANVKFAYIPNSFGVVETLAVAEALEKAKKTQEDNAAERYDGAAQTALNDAIAKVEAEKDGYTSPSECNGAVELLNSCSAALIDHAALCNNYDNLIKEGSDVVRQHATDKFAALPLYAQLVELVNKYHGVSVMQNDGTEEEPNWQKHYTYDVLKDDAALTTAVAELTDIVNTTAKLFTSGQSQRNTTGVAALVERLRLGAETLKTLGYDENSYPVFQALNALEDDDQLAEEVKNCIKTDIYGKLKDANNTLFEGTFDDEGNVLTPSYDMTVFVKNPNLYAREYTQVVEGWTNVSGNGSAWSSWDGNVSHNSKTPYVEDCCLYMGWHASCMTEQTITDLPAGVYTIKFSANDNSPESDGTLVYVKKSDTPAVEDGGELNPDVNFAAYAQVDNSGWDRVIEGVVVTDGYLTLGFKSGTTSQPFLEGVHILMTGAAEGFDYARGDDPDDTLTPLTTDMFHVWDNYIATSHIAVEDGGCEYHLNETVSPGNVIYGNVSVDYLHYADLTGYQSLNIEGTPDMVLRLLLNRTDVESNFIELNPTIGADGKATVDIAEYEFFHLNAIKLSWSSPSGIITSLTLTGKGKTDDNPGNDNPVVEGPALSIVGTTFKKGQENILPVSMQGAEDIISYQFDVAFPEGVKVSNITLNDRYARTHAISYNELDNQNVRIAVSASIPFSTSAGGRMPLSDVPFYQWDGWDAAATPIDPMYFAYVLGESTVLPYGDGNILGYADLSNYSKLKVTVTEGTPRFLFNRDVQEGQWSDNESESHLIDSSKGGWSSRYFSYEETENGTVYTVDLAWIKKDKGFAHLHAIKGANWTDVLVTDMEVEEASDDVLMNISVEVAETMDAGNYTVAVSNIEISNNTGETLKSADKNFTVSVVDNETEIADATLYISPVTTLMKGQENYIPVSLQSTQDVVACQFDLVLPENFDYKNIALSEANSETHNISYNWLDDGSIRFVIASLDNETFSRTGTSLFTLDLYIKDYLADGDYTIAVKNMMFTTEDYSTLTSADKDFVVMVADPIMMGDVNNDRKVDVTDVVLIIDEILGKYPNNFKAEAADVNGDGYINVTDVVLVIDNILGKVTLNRAPVADGELGSVALSSFNGDNSTVGVSLTNPTAYTAFQMDVTLPMGVSLVKAQLTGRGTDSHHVSISQTGEGRYRIVGVSMDNETLNGNSGNLLNMTLKSNTQAFGAIALDNVIFVTPNGTQHELNGVVSYGDATGIADVRMSDNKAEIYDLQGRRVNTLKKGLYINNGKKTVMK